MWPSVLQSLFCSRIHFTNSANILFYTVLDRVSVFFVGPILPKKRTWCCKKENVGEWNKIISDACFSSVFDVVSPVFHCCDDVIK